MKWLVVPVDELKQFDKYWEYRRKSVDGTQAIIHEGTYNRLVPPVVTIPETDGPIEVTYPYPLLGGEELVEMLNTSEWSTNLDLDEKI